MSSGEAEVSFHDEISPLEKSAKAAIRNTRPLSPATTRTYTCAPHTWSTIDSHDTETLNRDEVSSVHRETRPRARRNSVLIQTGT